MRVLFTAHGAYGHVLPLLGVARALADRGHEVVVATSADFCDVVARHGLAAEAAGTDDETLVAEAHRRWPWTVSEPPSRWTTRMFCEIAAPAMVAGLGPLIARWHPDVVVREEGEHGGPVAAAGVGLPWVTHGWGSPLCPPRALGDLVPLIAPLWERADLSTPTGDELYGGTVFDPCPPSLYGGQHQVAGRRAVRPATGGGAIDKRGGGRPPPRRPLAYVGFGTVPLFRDPPDLTPAVVGALLANGFDVTVTTGDAHLARHVAAMGPGRVNVERWVDLGRLLPGCALVACHGGAGTVLAALAAGVPLLLLPRGAPSQMRMSLACQARGVGRVVVWEGTNADQITAAVAELTSTDRFAAAATGVAGEIATMPDPSTAAAVLRDVVGREA